MNTKPNLNSDDTLRDRIRLSECFERMRKIINDKDVNNRLQDKEYAKLSINMGELARLGNECSGILFHFHLMTHTNVLETVDDDIATDGAAGMPPVEQETYEVPEPAVVVNNPDKQEEL